MIFRPGVPIEKEKKRKMVPRKTFPKPFEISNSSIATSSTEGGKKGKKKGGKKKRAKHPPNRGKNSHTSHRDLEKGKKKKIIEA